MTSLALRSLATVGFLTAGAFSAKQAATEFSDYNSHETNSLKLSEADLSISPQVETVVSKMMEYPNVRYGTGESTRANIYTRSGIYRSYFKIVDSMTPAEFAYLTNVCVGGREAT